MNLDDSYCKCSTIFEEVKDNLKDIHTEEDVKIQLITRMLTEVLCWEFSDIGAEVKNQNGYSDYVLSDRGKKMFLLEAKRKKRFSILVSEKSKMRPLKISGPGLQDAIHGIEQAANYSVSNGLSIAVLSDGVSWIVFKTFVPGDNYQDKEAYVFPSFDAVLKDFSLFYELLSKEAFRKRLQNALFDELHQNRLILSQPLYSAVKTSDIRINRKGQLAFDLDKVFSAFFEKLTGDDDSDLLVECFVESRESKIADFSLEKMTRGVLGNIETENSNVEQGLSNLIETAIEVDVGETVFIVGPTGAGKSTFLERFFSKTLPFSVRKRCVVIKVNFLDATGSLETVQGWMTEEIISALEGDMFEDGIPTYDDLKGLYYDEYQRRRSGSHAKLYERDKNQFQEDFGEFLSEEVGKNREQYLKKLLSSLVKSRKKLPIFLIDNTDEFPINYKEQIFQFSQSLRRHARHCLLLFPITDKSAWIFSKTDMYGIYQSKSFFLPTPPPREVFRKRIDFLKSRLNEVASTEMEGNYFTRKGIRISIPKLDKFARVLEHVFVEQDYTSKVIGELTNYNIRRTLNLSKRVITSSVFNIEDLLNSYVTGNPISPSFAKFMNALLKGDYDFYKQDENTDVYPIFQIDTNVRQSPLLNVRILVLLNNTRHAAKNIDESHMNVRSILNYFDSLGSSESSVGVSLKGLLSAGLIEPYDASIRDISDSQRFSISYSGRTHLRLALEDKVFFEQMAITTSILDETVVLKIAEISAMKNPDRHSLARVRGIFAEYLLAEDSSHVTISEKVDSHLSQLEVERSITKNFISKSEDNDSSDTLILGPGVVSKGVVAVVDSYDEGKGFGFVEVEEEEQLSKVFFHVSMLNESGIESVSDGDSLLCDIGREKKGLYVSRVHDIEEDSDQVECHSCVISKVYEDRCYGFADIEDSSRSVYFNFSVFKQVSRSYLSIGYRFKAEIKPDPKGRSLMVKRVLQL